MIVSKSTCGLCKPYKKIKRNRTKLKAIFGKAFYGGDLSVNLINIYEKRFKTN